MAVIKRFANCAIIILLLFIALLLSGCGGGGGGSVASIAPVDTTTQYSITSIADLPYGSYVADINDQGQIAGLSGDHAVIWEEDGAMQSLPDPNGGFNYGFVAAINNSGMVVGSTSYYDGYVVAWESGGNSGSYDWQTYCNRGNHVSGVNSSGTLVGYYRTEAPHSTFYISVPVILNKDDSSTELSIPNGYLEGETYDINDAGYVVGQISDGEDRHAAVVWNPEGHCTILQSRSWIDAAAVAINNSGQVAGNSDGPFVWNGTLRHLGILYNANRGYATDINDNGQVVGHVLMKSDRTQRAVLWQPDGKILVLPLLPGAVNSEAVAINNNGDIVGSCFGAVNTEGEYHRYNEKAVVWRVAN